MATQPRTGSKIISYKTVTSTSDKAKLLALRGANEWTVVVAEVQTKGRGRSGKTWQSRKGGLWFSIILRPKILPSKIPLLQFLASNAIRQALEEETGICVKTKWPNDLLANGRKLAGILVESSIKANHVSFVVIGIGLNVNQTKTTLLSRAVSIYVVTHRRHDPELLMNRIVERMKAGYDNLDTPHATLENWWSNCIHRSCPVIVRTGLDTLKGLSTGIDTDGSLIIETNHGKERAFEGTLKLVELKS